MKKLISFLFFSMLMIASLFADDYVITVSAPLGAPALSLATLAEKNPQQYTFLSAETITAEFANNNADFIIAPLNAGAKLFKMGKSQYKLAAVVCWGNLYFASQKKNFKLKDIQKSGITLFGENTINSSIALSVLEKNKIKPKSVHYLAGAANTQNLLLSDSNSIVLTAEPSLSAAKMKNKNIKSYSLNELYKKATGFDGYTQAGLFVRAKTIEEHPESVKDYLKQAKESVEKCTLDVAAVAKAGVSLGLFPNEKIITEALPQCAIRYMSALNARKQIETTANIDILQFGGALPSDDFYFSE